MTCPKCDYEQSCGCNSCQGRIPTEKPQVLLDEHGMRIACGNCAFEMNWMEWNELSVEQTREKK
jgi:hypothetical protein